MLYALTIFSIICVAGYVCHKMPDWMLRREYTRISTRILAGGDYDLDQFSGRWDWHPKYNQYMNLINKAIEKRGLGV